MRKQDARRVPERGAGQQQSWIGDLHAAELAQNVNIGRRRERRGTSSMDIDEVRLYNRALTQDEIQADMNAGVAAERTPRRRPRRRP